MNKILKLFLIFSLIASPCYSAIDSTVEWEARPDGVISNGGGYDTVSDGGTDHAIGNDGASKNSAADGATPDAVGPPYTFTSTSGTFTARDVGNRLAIIDIGDGGGANIDIYEIASINSGTSVELNASDIGAFTPTGGAETGIDWVVGGFKRHTGFTMVQGNTTLTSPTSFFTNDDIDNIIRISAGANFDVGWYQIMSKTDASNVVLDRTAAAGGAGSGGDGVVGGAVALAGGPDIFLEQMEPGQKLWVKTGTHTLTANVAVAKDANPTLPIRIEGYNSSRGDLPTIASGNQPTIACGANTFTFDNYWETKNITFTGTTAGAMTRVDLAGIFEDCKFLNSSEAPGRFALRLGNNGATAMRIDAQSTLGIGVVMGSSTNLISSYIHDCDGASAIGVDTSTNSAMIEDSVISNNTNGIQVTTGNYGLIKGCTFKDNDNAAIKITTGWGWRIVNNIFDDDLWSFVADNGGTVTKSMFFDNNIYNSAAGGDHSWDNKVSEDNSHKGANDITGDPVLGADFTISSGSNALSAAKQSDTDLSADLADYKVNIGVDQDDNAVGGGGSPIGWVSVAE